MPNDGKVLIRADFWEGVVAGEPVHPLILVEGKAQTGYAAQVEGNNLTVDHANPTPVHFMVTPTGVFWMRSEQQPTTEYGWRRIDELIDVKPINS